MLRCTNLASNRRPLHTTFVIAALVAAVSAQSAFVLTEVDKPTWVRWWHSPLAMLTAAIPAGPIRVDAASAAGLDDTFSRLDYQLDGVADGRGVPPVLLASVPADLGGMAETDMRKDVFLRLALPLVLTANEAIAADRNRLEALSASRHGGEALSANDQAWLDGLAERYDVEPGPAAIGQLLRRVDGVPPSLALAQAAIESGWGTSRQVRREHNMFGHTIENSDGTSMATFPSLMDAVNAYVHNLNTHHAYESLRRVRAETRAHGGIPEGAALASHLGAYSELGQAYVDDVRSVIRSNDLARLDNAHLRHGRLAAQSEL